MHESEGFKESSFYKNASSGQENEQNSQTANLNVRSSQESTSNYEVIAHGQVVTTQAGYEEEPRK